MTKRWLVGLVAAIAVVCMAGVGFSAFTAQATVYGNASAASVGLQIVQNYSFGCYYFGHAEAAPGSLSFTDLNEAQTAVSLNVANLTPDQICEATLTIENTGSQPLNVSIALNTPGSNGVCGPYGFNCFDVFTYSGIQASGDFWFDGSPTAPAPTAYSANFTYLNPGQSYQDFYGVDIPWGSNDTTPSSATFTLVYSASVGFNEA
ncbi:MAG: hypothetical protein ACLQD8_08695 [Thermoplasmata archaeon]